MKLKNIQPNVHELEPKELKNFLIEQYQDNQVNLKPKSEVLFTGRSNVGKSSLLNALFSQNIAHTSKKPGSTKKFYFHSLPKFNGFLIDAPGYGYSDVKYEAVKKWQGMINDYIKMSPRVSRIYFLINCEHGIKQNDQYMLQQLDKTDINIQIVMTKSDKVSESELYDKMLAVSHFLTTHHKNIHPLIHSVSSKTGFGVNYLQYSLIDTFKLFKPRNLDGVEEIMIKYLQARKSETKLNIKKIIQQKHKRQQLQLSST